jgi:phytoene dehydrogenase-like protein
MMNDIKYDVIVIGGGLSGLMAGITAAKRGKKTLLLEKHTDVGGLAAGFWRKGYYFDSGMSRCLSYISGPLKSAGIKVAMKPQRMIFNVAGCWIGYSRLEEFFSGLAEIFPEERDALLELYEKEIRPVEAILAKFFAGMDGNGGIQKLLSTIQMLGAMRDMKKLKSLNEMEGGVFERYLDKQGRAYSFLVEREDEVDYRGEMNFFAKVGKLYSQTANIYPADGYQSLANKMEAVIKTHRGEVRTGVNVKSILIEDGRAVGVEVETHGRIEQISAKTVICSIDLNKALYRLIGEKHLDDDLIDRLERSKLSRAIPILYLGINMPPEKIKKYFQRHEEVWFFPEIIPQPNEENFFRTHSMVVHSSSFHNSDHAPAGKTNLQVYLSCPPEGWMQNWGLEQGRRTERYQEIKEMVIEDILDSLESLIPDLHDRSLVEVCELGTPFTLERYTGNTDGSCLGYRMDADFINSRKMGKYFDRINGIANLYFSGQQTGYPGGVPNALGSGRHAGELV